MPDHTRPAGELIGVEVAYGEYSRQVLKRLEVPVGCTVAGAIEQSAITADFPDIEFDLRYVGIFGRVVPADSELQEGDRVEIYRPLKIDPKESRRRRAASQSDSSSS